jgi:hypothetical protein
MSTVRIGYEGEEPEGSVVAAAEIIDARLEVVAQLPVLSGSGRSIPLREPGSYLIRGWLPSGQQLTATFETAGKHETVILRAPDIPAEPIAGTEPPGTAARQDTWALIWALQDGQWTPLPTRKLHLGQDGVSIEIPATSTGSAIVQVGGALPTLMTVIPATGSPARISVQPDRQPGTPGWRWRVDVPADPGLALLRYLENGDLRSARILTDVLLDKSPWPYETPLLAAAAGYVLLRIGDRDKLSALTERYQDLLAVLPDGAVIRAWMQLHEPEPDFAKVRNLLQDAAAQLPIASEGLRLLSRGLRVLARLKQDDALSTALDRIAPLAAAIALQTDPLTAFSGRAPAAPSVRPVATEVGARQDATLFQMPGVLRSTTGRGLPWAQDLTPAAARRMPHESPDPQVFEARGDDVIYVAGHRLGTRELECAALTVPEVAEAAAVPVVDDVRGRVVEMYVCLYPGIKASSVIEAKVNEAIETDIGKIGRPKNIWIVPDLPRTRSGDIVRGVVAAVSNFADVGDITMLVNPEVVESIRHHVQGRKISKDRIFKQPGH